MNEPTQQDIFTNPWKPSGTALLNRVKFAAGQTARRFPVHGHRKAMIMCCRSQAEQGSILQKIISLLDVAHTKKLHGIQEHRVM